MSQGSDVFGSYGGGITNTPLHQQGRQNGSSIAATQAEHCTEQCIGWSRYFPSDPFADDFPYLAQINNLRGYFASLAVDLLQEHPEPAVAALVDFHDLASAEILGASSGAADGSAAGSSTPVAMSSVAADIREQPAIVLKCMGLAMYVHLIYLIIADRHTTSASPLLSAWPVVCVHVQHHDP